MTIYILSLFFIVSFLSLKYNIPNITNLWAVNFQRCGYAFHHHHTWCSLSPIYCWWLFNSKIFHLLSLLQPLTLLACSLDASPCMPAIVLYYWTFPGTVVSTVQYMVRLKMFSLFLFLIYCLREKYYKTITVKYYIADCVSWVPRLTLLNLWTVWTWNSFKCREIIV